MHLAPCTPVDAARCEVCASENAAHAMAKALRGVRALCCGSVSKLVRAVTVSLVQPEPQQSARVLTAGYGTCA